MWGSVLGTIAFAAVAAHLVYRFVKQSRRRKDAPARFFGDAMAAIPQSRLEPTATIGYPELIGRYRDLSFRVRPVVDTLAVRKLPSLWLLVTVPEPLPVSATLDLMMRPAGPTTFSNFESLPATIETPPDFPRLSVVRTDDPEHMLPLHVIRPHLSLFENPAAKELLLTPKGLRIVWQIAEADRGRYGIFRQAEFGNVSLDADLLLRLLDQLIEIRKSVLAWKEVIS